VPTYVRRATAHFFTPIVPQAAGQGGWQQ